MPGFLSNLVVASTGAYARTFLRFLAPFDAVSRAHGMGGLCPSSVVSIRICVALISEPITCISFKFLLQVAAGPNQGGK